MKYEDYPDNQDNPFETLRQLLPDLTDDELNTLYNRLMNTETITTDLLIAYLDDEESFSHLSGPNNSPEN